MPPKRKSEEKPYCFVSYSSREPHVQVLVPCLWIAFSVHFDLKLTPSALESGASQRNQIEKLIKNCEFAIVSLDGLRPNVTYEYGMLEGYKKPIILLKEKSARVDVMSLLGNPPGLAIEPPSLNVDSHFSNVKDVAYAEWDRLKPAETVKLILDEYDKKRARIERYVTIEIPDLWSI